ncbi:MAG: hypothetical protein HC821_00700 [Lewinella sp.]|nr:hypothetical protein [Lewinella sp.]
MAALKGDFGTSYLNRQPVAQKIWPALLWTALLNGLALAMSYLLAIPLGLYAAYYAGSRFDRGINLLLLLFYSLPGFWLATLLSNFITTPLYGLAWFPTMGVGNVSVEDDGLLHYLLVRCYHWYFPFFVWLLQPWRF